MSDTKDIAAMLTSLHLAAWDHHYDTADEYRAAILAAFAERDARIAELEADAERYQWLFDHDDSKTSRVNLVYRMWDGQSDWNAAVDAAREGK